MTPIYRVDGDSVVTSPDAAGPWDRRMQHGSAPASLVTWAAERIPTPVPMNIARVTIDLMRPVPVAPLTIETEVLREGRKIQLCEIKLLADGVQVVGATVLKIKRQALTLPDGRQGAAGYAAVAGGLADRGRPCRHQSVRAHGLDARRARPLRPGRRRRDLVSRRPSAGRRRSGLAGDARRGRGRFLQRHRLDARFPRLDLHQCRPYCELFAPAGRRMDLARRRILDRSRWRRPCDVAAGGPSTAISAARCRAW